MNALSIRQPWAWLILHAGKNVENRDWRFAPRFRGPFLIHAAAGMTRDEYDQAQFRYDQIRRERLPEFPGVPLPPRREIERGGIVGVATLSKVIGYECPPAPEDKSPWFCGPLGFVLTDVRPLPFTLCRGMLGFFKVPPDVEAQVKTNLGGAAK